MTNANNSFDLSSVVKTPEVGAPAPGTGLAITGSLDNASAAAIVQAQASEAARNLRLSRARALVNASFRRTVLGVTKDRDDAAADLVTINEDIVSVKAQIGVAVRNLTDTPANSALHASPLPPFVAALIALPNNFISINHKNTSSELTDAGTILMTFHLESDYSKIPSDIIAGNRGVEFSFTKEFQTSAFTNIHDLITQRNSLQAERAATQERVAEFNAQLKTLETNLNDRLSTLELELDGAAVTDEMAAQVVGDFKASTTANRRRRRRTA